MVVIILQACSQTPMGGVQFAQGSAMVGLTVLELHPPVNILRDNNGETKRIIVDIVTKSSIRTIQWIWPHVRLRLLQKGGLIEPPGYMPVSRVDYLLLIIVI